MCGIYGAAGRDAGAADAASAFARMGPCLAHRGPDGRGERSDAFARLGVERLRVMDPLPRSDQPFADPSGAVWLACNGEIYNAAALRRRYAAYPYRSRSDVEPILPLYLDRGPAGLADIDGMFAIAIWDGPRRRLVLARDRAGEKPLFHARLGGTVWFASEIQALLQLPSLSRELDTAAVADLLSLGYVASPRTLFTAVRSLEPGTIVTCEGEREEVRRYWAPWDAPPLQLPEGAAARRLDSLLQDAVAKQVAADVPIGVFTSGGVDSGLLAAMAARLVGPGALHTFTVGFGEPSYDERAPAARLAQALGTRHHAVTCDDASRRDALETLTSRIAEPVADPAALPTYLLARAARDHVTAVLSGEGADELFGGYPTYVGHALAPRFSALPAPVRAGVTALVNALPASRRKVPLEYLLKRFVAAAHLEPVERHVAWFGTGQDPHCPSWRPPPLPTPAGAAADPLRRILLFDYLTYLPNHLLVKVDRATMLASLEARSPYLDRDLTTFALGLDPALKIRGLTTKWLLKQVAARWLPGHVIRRRKRGLSVPLGAWINGGLRDEVDRLLAHERLEREGVLSAGRLRQLLSDHRQGARDHARALWPAIIFQYWRERWLGR